MDFEGLENSIESGEAIVAFSTQDRAVLNDTYSTFNNNSNLLNAKRLNQSIPDNSALPYELKLFNRLKRHFDCTSSSVDRSMTALGAKDEESAKVKVKVSNGDNTDNKSMTASILDDSLNVSINNSSLIECNLGVSVVSPPSTLTTKQQYLGDDQDDILLPESGWITKYSEKRGCKYWFNINTGVSQWCPPS